MLGSNVYSFQLTDAAVSRSMIVGTHRTGLARYGPLPAGSGTQDGSIRMGPPDAARPGASNSESQPHPLRGTPGRWTGFRPVKPSRFPPVASSRCDPQLGTPSDSKIRSATPKRRAKRAKFGMSRGRY